VPHCGDRALRAADADAQASAGLSCAAGSSKSAFIQPAQGNHEVRPTPSKRIANFEDMMRHLLHRPGRLGFYLSLTCREALRDVLTIVIQKKTCRMCFMGAGQPKTARGTLVQKSSARKPASAPSPAPADPRGLEALPLP